VRFTHEHAEAAISLAMDQGFPQWMTVGAMLRGWALAQQGQAQEGIAQIQQGLTAWRATGAEISRPYFLALLTQVHGTMGQPEEGLAVLTEALTLVDTTGERWYEPELYHLKGALLVQQSSDNQVEAEAYFHKALDIARNVSGHRGTKGVQASLQWEVMPPVPTSRLTGLSHRPGRGASAGWSGPIPARSSG
jgi:predicted ATPase